MSKIRAIFFTLAVTSLLHPESAMDIIRRVDSNEDFVTQKYTATMVITRGSRELKKTMTGYGASRGEKAFIEFTNPADKGVKYLKLNNELWIYFPDADDIMKISGHMLRQGMMGSDLSYEDMMRAEKLEEDYSAKLLEDKTIRGRSCYQVELAAKTPEALFARQIIFVDKEWYTAHSVELYAHGGRLLKTMELQDIKLFQGKYVPTKTVIEDKRRKNSKTTLILHSIEINGELADSVFTHKNLRK